MIQQVELEEKIRKQFAGEKFVKQLPVAKNYLYNLIIKSLSAFNSGKTAASKINGLITHAVMLSEKNLLQQSRKLLRRAKKLAYRYEQFNQILEILHNEKVLSSKELHSNTVEAELDKILKEEKQITDKINNINEYYNLTSKIYLLTKVADARSEKELSDFEKIRHCPSILVYFRCVQKNGLQR